VRKGRLRVLAASIAVLAILPFGEATAELIQVENLLITVNGGVVPKKLPRQGNAPVRIKVSGSIATTDGKLAPQLEQFELEVNRHGRLLDRGLPRCNIAELRDATTKQALRNCRDALVGHGFGAAEIALPDQAPFPAQGRLLAFNARLAGRRAVVGHVYGAEPVPVTTIVPFRIAKARSRPFGARIVAELPTVAADWGYVSEFRMTIGRRFRHAGKRRSYLNASCPAPRELSSALFDAVRATYRFEGGRTVQTTLQRQCKVAD